MLQEGEMAEQNSKQVVGETLLQEEDADASFKEDPPIKKESPAELLARHERERKELQNKETALKKAAAKGSKAEQKAKKKQVEEEIAKLEAKLKARHTKELASLDESNSEEPAGLNGVTKSFLGLSTLGPQVQKPSKAQKRRDRKAFLDAERESRIQEEQSNLVSNRVVENQQLESKLRPLGLNLKEVKPDGHCLYRALEDQLALYPHASTPFSYQQLREMAASYMRSHSEEFIPFMGSENSDDEARFESYCQEVESTAAWGGQLELGALAHSLKKHIVVFSGNLPVVEMGKEYESIVADGGESSNPSLRLSYHRYAYGLGEHYNSVVPFASSAPVT